MHPRIILASLATLPILVAACGPTAEQTAVSATVESAHSAATIQAAVAATLAAVPTSTPAPQPTVVPVQVATAPPAPAPAQAVAVAPQPAAPPVQPTRPQVAPAPLVPPTAPPVTPSRPSVGQQLRVGSLGYLVPDGKGKQLIGEGAVTALTQDPRSLLAGALNGSIYHLDGGTLVEVLDPPGAHGTHVHVLDGKHAGTLGSMLNRSLGF